MTWRAITNDVQVSESLAALSDFAERLYWRMLAMSDAWGRLPGAIPKVRVLCVPLLDRTDEAILSALSELERVERIYIYPVDGVRYVQLTDFDKHQPRDVLGREGRRFASKYPDPPSDSAQPSRASDSTRHSAARRGTPPSESESERKAKGSSVPKLATPRKLPSKLTWGNVSETLRDADDGTHRVIAQLILRHRLPEAALHTAFESLEARRKEEKAPLVSEVRYFVATLKRMADEKQYGRDAA